jgi:hypothetical protein
MPRTVVIKKKQLNNVADFIKVVDAVKVDILRQMADEYNVSFEVLSSQYLRKI